MKPLPLSVLVLATVLSLTASTAPAADKTPALAGWYDLFPATEQRLHPHFDQPVVGKGKDGEAAYSQAAHYDALTGLPRAFTVTMARSAEFKTLFGKDALKKTPATALEVGTRTAWVWTAEGRNREFVTKVVVPVAADAAVIIENDPGSEPMPLVEYAKSLDFDRIEKALANPPRTDFTPTLQTFAVFRKSDSVRGMYEWAGPAKTREQVGEKADDRFRWTYAMKDGSKVAVLMVGSKIETITHEPVDGKGTEILK